MWWLGLHLLAATGVAASGLAAGVKLLLVVAVLGHTVRWPRATPGVVRFTNGAWALMPAPGDRAGVAKAPVAGAVELLGSSSGPFWVSLRFRCGGKPTHVLILCDQLSVADWRALRAAVGTEKI